MKSVRIYGFVRGYGSYAQVTRGFAQGFRAHGWSSEALDLFGLEEEPSFDEEPTGLPQADIAILTGPPIAAPRMASSVRHEMRCVMVAPNSDKLPEKTMLAVNQHATHILSPSQWGATVLARYTDKPIVVVPHGIDPAFRLVPDPKSELEVLYEREEFRVLHLSSTEGQRKGTRELCRAFVFATEEGVLPAGAKLELVLTPGARGRMLEWLMDQSTAVRARIVLRDRLNMDGASPDEMAREVYSRVHVVCQPSRGEGFGLVPLEALACGVPVVATRCTGHAEWFRWSGMPGTVEVATRPPEPIDDVPGARAPTIHEADLVEALGRAYRHWHVVKSDALSYAESTGLRWSWPAQTGAFIRWLNPS